MKLFYKLFALFLCALLVVPCLTAGVYALPSADELDPERPHQDSRGYILWSYHEETDTIRGLGKEYVRYYPSGKMVFDGTEMHIFSNTIRFGDKLYSYDDDPEIIALRDDEDIYVTEVGKVSLDALQAGNAVTFALKRYDSRYAPYAQLDHALYAELMAKTETKSFEVATLRETHVCYIYGYDGTGAFAMPYGALYQVDGTYYYVHYLTLDNRYFDAYGGFSYRSGSVDAIILGEELAERFHRLVLLMDYRDVNTEYEDSDLDLDGDLDENTSVGFFVFSVIVIGFLLPLPLLIVGICMARSVTRGYPKYWYALSVVAVLWMVISVLMMILML